MIIHIHKKVYDIHAELIVEVPSTIANVFSIASFKLNEKTDKIYAFEIP